MIPRYLFFGKRQVRICAQIHAAGRIITFSSILPYDTSSCQKSGRFFVNTQDTINSARTRGSQKSLLSCTHTKILCHICVDCPILSRLICDLGGGYIEDIVLNILVDSHTNVCAKWCFYTRSWLKSITKLRSHSIFNHVRCPMSPPQDVMPYPRLQGSHYPRQWWPGNRLPLPCNYPPRRQWPGSHYPRQWWPGNWLPLSGSHPPWLCSGQAATDSSKVISAKLFMGMRYVMYCNSCISMNASL